MMGDLSKAPSRIANLRDNLSAAPERAGVDRVIVTFQCPFRRFVSRSFLSRIFGRRLACEMVMVGDDFRFGAKRAISTP